MTMDTSIEANLIGLLSKRDKHERYRRFIKDYTVLKETHTIVEDLGAYFKAYPDKTDVDWALFKTWFRVVRHPTWKPAQYEIFDAILDNAAKQVPDEIIVNRFKELDYAARVKEKCEEVIAGRSSGETIRDEAAKDSVAGKEELNEYFVDMDISRLVDSVLTGHGIEWRLPPLNTSVGQLHKSDFVLIGKRPEVGGTTFLISEFTHMINQLPEGKNAIIFNNEEGGDKLAIRLIQAALNLTTMDIIANPKAAIDDYNKFLGTRKITIMHKVDLSFRDIRDVCKGGDYWLIGINVLEKVHGYDKEDDVKRRAKLANECRQLADAHGVVMAVSQAGDSAEGVKFLNQSHLYGSKTGVQGEIDVMIMIGASHEAGEADIRGVSICKNKKPTTGKMIPTHKHLKFQCKIEPEYQRFVEL